jgi:hypothetical protein
MAMRDPAPSPLDVLETTFRLLTTGPDPLALDGHTLGCGLPARPIPLDELRSILLHPSTSFPARDAALGELVRRAQTHGGAWTVGLAGVLLPGLRRVAGHLAREFPGDTADIDAEVLTGFLEALAKLHLHPGRRRIAAHLLWGAFNRGKRLRRMELEAFVRRVPLDATSAVPPPPAGHPDILLARAVRHGVLAAWEAELIGATRLEGADLLRLAAEGDYKPDTLRHWRRAAERRLATWLVAGTVPAPPVSGERPPPPGRAARRASPPASAGMPAGGVLGHGEREGRATPAARRSSAARPRQPRRPRRSSTRPTPPSGSGSAGSGAGGS